MAQDTVKKEWIIAVAGLVLLFVCPYVLPIYWTMILTEILIMGLLAMGFNLLLGYTGLLSFGQAGFFGVGAYAAALAISKGGMSIILALAVAVLASAAVAAVIGFLCVRRDEIYFAMITLGFGMMLYTVAHNWIELTGGSDGLPLMIIPPLRFFGREISLFSPENMYTFVLSVTALGIFLLWRVVRSPFGLMLTAIRENKERLAFVGAGVRQLRLFAFIIAGSLAGLAGGFYLMLYPIRAHMAIPLTIKALLIVVLGGMGRIFPTFWAAFFFGLVEVLTGFWGSTEIQVLVPYIGMTVVLLMWPEGIGFIRSCNSGD